MDCLKSVELATTPKYPRSTPRGMTRWTLLNILVKEDPRQHLIYSESIDGRCAIGDYVHHSWIKSMMIYRSLYPGSEENVPIACQLLKHSKAIQISEFMEPMAYVFLQDPRRLVFRVHRRWGTSSPCTPPNSCPITNITWSAYTGSCAAHSCLDLSSFRKKNR
jgi:hypothetical protein